MGRVAVVTGAASGMGLAIGRHLAARGDRVALLDVRGDAALGAAEGLRETGGRAIGVEVGVTDRAAVDGALEKVRAMVSFPVEIWRQPYLPDTGTAAFELKLEPIL